MIGLLAGVALYQAKQATSLKQHEQELRERTKVREQEIQQVHQQCNRLAHRLAEAQAKLDELEMKKCADSRKAEADRPRASQTVRAANDPFGKRVLELKSRSAELHELFQNRPRSTIPEMQFMKEALWMSLAEMAEKFDLSNDEVVREIMAATRDLAKDNFLMFIDRAADAFAKANPQKPLTDLQQLKPFFQEPIEEALLLRYKVVKIGDVNRTIQGDIQGLVQDPAETLVMEVASPADQEFDRRVFYNLNRHGARTIRCRDYP